MGSRWAMKICPIHCKFMSLQMQQVIHVVANATRERVQWTLNFVWWGRGGATLRYPLEVLPGRCQDDPSFSWGRSGLNWLLLWRFVTSCNGFFLGSQGATLKFYLEGAKTIQVCLGEDLALTDCCFDVSWRRAMVVFFWAPKVPLWSSTWKVPRRSKFFSGKIWP